MRLELLMINARKNFAGLQRKILVIGLLFSISNERHEAACKRNMASTLLATD